MRGVRRLVAFDDDGRGIVEWTLVAAFLMALPPAFILGIYFEGVMAERSIRKQGFSHFRPDTRIVGHIEVRTTTETWAKEKL